MQVIVFMLVLYAVLGMRSLLRCMGPTARMFFAHAVALLAAFSARYHADEGQVATITVSHGDLLSVAIVVAVVFAVLVAVSPAAEAKPGAVSRGRS